MIAGARSRGLPPTTIAVALLTTVLAGVTSAHAGSLTIAWDPSPDPSVIGYRVYIGTTSGLYTETFDLGNVTTFSYNAVEGRTYYFSVAAYAPGPIVGPRSREVSAPGGALQGDAASYWSSLWARRSTSSRVSAFASPAARTTSSAGCWEPAGAECVAVQTIARVNAWVPSLAAASDGRLFFVEGFRRVRVTAGTALADEPVVIARSHAIALHQVAIDPTFAENGVIWVSETETGADGNRTFAVARYRVVENRATDRAVIVSGIALPPVGNAVFTIDASRRIYVAVPASPDVYDPYWGMVLRFNADGTVPEGQSGSPVLATGYTFPLAIAPTPSGDSVWLSDVERALSALPHGNHQDLLSITSNGVLQRASAAHDSLETLLSLNLTVGGRPITLSVGPRAEIYLSVHTPGASGTTSIVRLLPMR